MFKKILIANRGEIAVRLIRACRELGITTVAVYSDADRSSLHVLAADEAYHIGAAPAEQSYLNAERIIEVARAARADAILPGYGFLSEEAGFAELCANHDIKFIAPNPQAIRIMSKKLTSRAAVSDAGVAPISGMMEALQGEDDCQEWATRLGYPLIIKADGGSGGQAMRKVDSPDELLPTYRAVKNEADTIFADDTVYMERYIENSRHIEVQILGDRYGNLIHLGERDCSIQRNHQKLIEEAPSPLFDDKKRERLGQMAIAIAHSINYDSAGTVEFILDTKTGEFFFLKMNPHLTVGHAVTEMITGIDLCKEMIAVAAHQELTLRQEDVQIRGHAIGCRIFAGDPDNDFLPTPGRIAGLRIPGGPGVRDDSGTCEGFEVPAEYSPLMSKLAVLDRDRKSAIARCRRALSEYIVKGIKTTIPFNLQVMKNETFINGDYNTTFIDNHNFNANKNDNSHSDAKIATIAAAIKSFRLDRERLDMTFSTDREKSDLNPWKLSGRIQSLNNR